MKILHIINSLDIGGAESLLGALLENWEDEHHVVVLQGVGPLSDRVSRAAASLTSIGATRSSRDLWKMARGVQGKIDRIRPDVIHSHLVQSDFVSLLSKARGARRITSVHVASIQDTDPPRSRIMARVVGRMSGLFSSAIATSERSREYMETLGYSCPITVINNGTPVVSLPPFDADKVVFLSLARFNPVKGHDVLLEAFQKHLASYPKSELLCAGEGVTLNNASFASLASRVENFQACKESVRFVGPSLNVRKLFERSTALVISSFSETFPMVGSEACMHGIPVITTDVGDAGSFALRKELLVAPRSPGELAMAMNYYAGLRPEDRMVLSDESRRKAVEQFDIRITARRYADVYREVVHDSFDAESLS